MKIGQSPENSVSIQIGNAAASQKNGQASSASAVASSSAAQAPRSAGVAVTMSNMARGLEKAAKGDASSDIDTKKVAAVKASIEDGSFTVNAEAIADKLLANTKEMLDRTTR